MKLAAANKADRSTPFLKITNYETFEEIFFTPKLTSSEW
jgi:hypothetical protein